MDRIKFIDGFRGLAIFLVIVYHAYARWPLLVPYGNEFSSFPFFKYGWLGVQLFFLISGFVILMTLEKSRNFKQFIIKRWLRLFPAMLIATILIYFTANYFSERPAGIPTLTSVIPGLIFIEPSWIFKISGIEISILEGVFWSLFVEVKYYFIFGLLYFYLGRNKAIVAVFTCFIFYCSFLLNDKLMAFSSLKPLLKISQNLSFNEFGWFASGSFAYLYFETKNKKHLLYACICGFSAALSLGFANSAGAILFASFLLIIFISAVYFEDAKKIFANKLFVFIGFVSYPLYLIHENAMIAMIIKLHAHLPFIPDLLLPILPVLLLILVAYLIAKILEPMLKKLLSNFVIQPSLRGSTTKQSQA